MNSSKPQGIILVIGSHTSLHISGVHVNRFLSVHLSIHSLQDRAQFASKVRACPLCAEFIRRSKIYTLTTLLFSSKLLNENASWYALKKGLVAKSWEK